MHKIRYAGTTEGEYMYMRSVQDSERGRGEAAVQPASQRHISSVRRCAVAPVRRATKPAVVAEGMISQYRFNIAATPCAATARTAGQASPSPLLSAANWRTSSSSCSSGGDSGSCAEARRGDEGEKGRDRERGGEQGFEGEGRQGWGWAGTPITTTASRRESGAAERHAWSF